MLSLSYPLSLSPLAVSLSVALSVCFCYSSLWKNAREFCVQFAFRVSRVVVAFFLFVGFVYLCDNEFAKNTEKKNVNLLNTYLSNLWILMIRRSSAEMRRISFEFLLLTRVQSFHKIKKSNWPKSGPLIFVIGKLQVSCNSTFVFFS